MKTQVTMTICDRHHQQGEDVPATPRRFTIDGFEASADLCDECYQNQVGPLIDFLRSLSSARPSRRASQHDGHRRSRKGAVDTAAVRAWAVDSGIEVSPRGRLRKDIIDRYRSEHA